MEFTLKQTRYECELGGGKRSDEKGNRKLAPQKGGGVLRQKA